MNLKCFEDYLTEAYKLGIVDHALRYDGGGRGYSKFCIHPALVSGETMDYEVQGNDLSPVISESDVDEFMNSDSELTEKDKEMLKSFDVSRIIQKVKLNRDVQDTRLILLLDCLVGLAKSKPTTTIADFAPLIPRLMKFAKLAIEGDK